MAAETPLNTFAEGSDVYALARPFYPAELFEWIAEQSPALDSVWDCATGNGQAALGLAAHFAAVEASDIAASQIGHGLASPSIRYSAQPAEATGFAEASFDAVTVAQALHWFDLPRFWAEVRRVAKPGAFFCAWGMPWSANPTNLKPDRFGRRWRRVGPIGRRRTRTWWEGIGTRIFVSR